MKLYRCEKCAVVYAFPPDIGRVPPCTRTWRETSRSGIIGDYDAYCAGALVPVTLDVDPTPVERDHGDRSQGDGREAIERAEYERARDREGIERARVARDRRIRWYRRNEYERDDALTGSRRAYWRKVLDTGPQEEKTRAGGARFFNNLERTIDAIKAGPAERWPLPCGADR